jgi:hypothetical protein
MPHLLIINAAQFKNFDYTVLLFTPKSESFLLLMSGLSPEQQVHGFD